MEPKDPPSASVAFTCRGENTLLVKRDMCKIQLRKSYLCFITYDVMAPTGFALLPLV